MDDSEKIAVPDARTVVEVLRTDPFFACLGERLAHPVVLGVVVAVIVVATIVLGPSTDSRFIYTDF